MLMLFNSFKDNVIDEETGPDEYVRACVEKYGCIEGFCAIFVTENRYYCYSYSPERILVFRRSNLFNLKYTCVEKVEKIQLKRTGYCLYKKTGKTKEGDYYVWFDGYRMISTEVEYLGNILAMNNIFRSNRLGYKSCRELLHIMRKTHNTHNKNISKNALSMVIISCQGSF